MFLDKHPVVHSHWQSLVRLAAAAIRSTHMLPHSPNRQTKPSTCIMLPILIALLWSLCAGTQAHAQSLPPSIQQLATASTTCGQLYVGPAPALTDPVRMSPVTWSLVTAPGGMTIAANG